MIYPLVRELAATSAPIRVPVAVTCRVLKITKQPFYRWLKDPVSARDWDDAHLTNAAVDIHRDDPVFGYRFIADELEDLGFDASERRVWRLCSQQRLWSAFSKKKGTSNRKQGPPVHDDLVQRKFFASGPNELWLTDITEHWTSEGKLYCCAIKDVFSNRIVGYSIDDNMTAQLAVNALQMAMIKYYKAILPTLRQAAASEQARAAADRRQVDQTLDTLSSVYGGVATVAAWASLIPGAAAVAAPVGFLTGALAVGIDCGRDGGAGSAACAISTGALVLSAGGGVSATLARQGGASRWVVELIDGATASQGAATGSGITVWSVVEYGNKYWWGG